jgi:hypothetical protein
MIAPTLARAAAAQATKEPNWLIDYPTIYPTPNHPAPNFRFLRTFLGSEIYSVQHEVDEMDYRLQIMDYGFLGSEIYSV